MDTFSAKILSIFIYGGNRTQRSNLDTAAPHPYTHSLRSLILGVILHIILSLKGKGVMPSVHSCFRAKQNLRGTHLLFFFSHLLFW